MIHTAPHTILSHRNSELHELKDDRTIDGYAGNYPIWLQAANIISARNIILLPIILAHDLHRTFPMTIKDKK